MITASFVIGGFAVLLSQQAKKELKELSGTLSRIVTPKSFTLRPCAYKPGIQRTITR